MIRVMKESDIKKVHEIAVESFSDAWSEALLEDSVNNASEYGIVYETDGEYDAESAGDIAGFAILSVSVDVADVVDIAVSPGYRGRGMADALLDNLTAYGKSVGINQFALEVRESNIPAITLYEKHGFRRESVRKKYYKNPVEDALIMWKR